MDRLRVLIGEDESVAAEGLRAKLERLGHSVVGIGHDGRDAVAKAESLTPDLILLDIKMPRLDGLEATREIMAHRPVPIILVTAHSDPDLIQRAMEAGVMGYLVKPVALKELGPAIALALSRFADLMALRKDVQGLKEALLVRQQVERAKGILQHRHGLSEEEAYLRLRNESRRLRRPMKDLAEAIILAEDLSRKSETSV